jgi:uncharacterized protein (TIGR00369 family)
VTRLRPGRFIHFRVDADDLLHHRLDELFRAVALGSTLGATLDAWGPGWAEFSMTPGPTHANLGGTVHGAVVYALGDLAFEVACNSYGRKCVASQVNIHYAAAAGVAEKIRARAEEVTRSHRVASYRVTITAGELTVAWLQAVAYRTSQWHLPEAEIPDDWRASH